MVTSTPLSGSSPSNEYCISFDATVRTSPSHSDVGIKAITAASSPLPDVLQAVRAGFIYQGTNLSRWCRENNVSKAYAWPVLQGRQRVLGAKGVALRRRIIEASCVDDPILEPKPSRPPFAGLEPAR